MQAGAQTDSIGRLDAAEGRRAWLLACIAAALAAGAALRLDLNMPHGLWEDEIIAVTHAVQPWPSLIINVFRNDIHPPLYFAQLSLWSWFGDSDAWFKANSMAWSLAAIVSLWLAVRAEAGRAAAWTSAAFLAALPSAVWMAQEVRPYAWLSVLLIWAYRLCRRAFAEPSAPARVRPALLLLCVAITWSHAIGFFAVLFLGVFSLTLLVRRGAARADYAAWAALYGLAAVGSAPVLASNLLHDANLGASASPRDLLAWCSSVVTVQSPSDWTFWSGAALYFGIAGAGVLHPRTRLIAACFLVAPLLAAAGLAAVLKPIFKANFFATLSAPFLAIVAAELCAAVRPRIRPLAAAAGLAFLLVLSAACRDGKSTSTDFRQAAADIAAQARPGDVVLAPQPAMFWGMARYLAGPRWGSPLVIARPPSAQWLGVYDRLGPRVVDMLGLTPGSQSLPLPDGATLVAGSGLDAVPERPSQVWLATYARADLPAGLPGDHLGPLQRREERRYLQLVVTRYE